MAYARDLYLNVSSEDSSDYFPDNTPCDFRVKLPRRFILEGDWSMCINQIWVDKMWYNVIGCYLTIQDNTGNKTVVRLPNGYYTDISQFVDKFNELCLINNEQLVRLEYDDVTHKVTVDVISDYNIRLSENLSEILGTAYKTFIGKSVLEKCADLNINDKICYVYCDLAEGGVYSDSIPNNVKIISVANYIFGDVVYEGSVSNYSRVCVESFDTVRIQIKNRKNSGINNLGGSTLVQLYFRRD